MTFSATIRTNINGIQNSTSQTVPATVSFNPGNNQLSVSLGAWSYTLTAPNGTAITTVNVSGYYSLSFPIQPQTATVTLPNGSPATVTARVVSATTQYLSGKVIVNASVGF